MAPKTKKTTEDAPEQRPRSSRAAKLNAEKEKEAAAANKAKKAGVKKQSKAANKKKAAAAKTKKQPKRKSATATKAKRATATPSRDKVDEGRVDTILNQLPLHLLHSMCQTIKVSTATTKKQCTDNIIAWCESHGERHLIDSLEKEVLKETVETLEGSVTHDNKGKMQHVLRKGLTDLGQAAVFNKCSSKLLDQLTKVFDFEEEGGKTDKVNALVQEIVLWGALEAFGRMKSDWVGEVAALFKIPKSSKGSTKATTIKKILGVAFSHLTDEAQEEEERRKSGEKEPAAEEEEEEPVEPVEKKPIKKGVTQLDLYQYYVGELVDYCKDNKLKVSGSKKDITKRILAFLGGDIEGTRAMKPGEAAKLKKSKKKTIGKRKAETTKSTAGKKQKTK